MQAVRLAEIGQPLRMFEIPIPALGSRDVLVRVRAAGICHSDAHYRAGVSPVAALPITLGHEVAGVVERTGDQVNSLSAGDRVAIHYLATCGECHYCRLGYEQFCLSGEMIGEHRDGGYAEYIAVPARSAVPLPSGIPFEAGAIMMCSTATSFHALRRARLQPGESVALYGTGGLGMSAIQLALTFGALHVYAVDIDAGRLAIAEQLGAVPVDAAHQDPVEAVRGLTGGKGVDVALELVGLPQTMQQAVRSLAIMGRAVLVGITDEPFPVYSYTQVLGKETEIIGASDHRIVELPLLFDFARRGKLDLAQIVTRRIPLDAAAINDALDSLQRYGAGVRTVIVP